MKEKLEEYIENLERLSADARYFNNADNYEKLKIELESIIYWAEKSKRLLEKESK